MGVKLIDFYCVPCRKDFRLASFLVVLNSMVGMGWRADCPDCGKKLVRLQDVNARHDPYFRKSRYIKASIRRNQDALVQVNDPRFNYLYPQHARAEAEALEAKEKGIWKNKMS